MRMRLSQWELLRTSTGAFGLLCLAQARAGRAWNCDQRLTWWRNSIFEAELQDVIPICHATIAGTRIVGRLTAGYVPPSSMTAGVVNSEMNTN